MALDQQGTGLTVQQLHAEFDKLRELHGKKAAAKANLTKADAAYRQQMAYVRELAETEGITGGLRTRAGGYEVPEPTWFASVQDLRAFTAWAEANAPAAVPPPTTRATEQMNRLVREAIEDGRQPPPGLGAYPKAVVKVKK